MKGDEREPLPLFLVFGSFVRVYVCFFGGFGFIYVFLVYACVFSIVVINVIICIVINIVI